MNKSKHKIAVTSRSFSFNKILRSELDAIYSFVKYNETGKKLNGEEIQLLQRNLGLAEDGVAWLQTFLSYYHNQDNSGLEELMENNIRVIPRKMSLQDAASEFPYNANEIERKILLHNLKKENIILEKWFVLKINAAFNADFLGILNIFI